ncbi:uncharacterized protein METZ01_LOCUS506412, partial [marine metagenome]
MLPTLEHSGTFGPVPLGHFNHTLFMATDFTPL